MNVGIVGIGLMGGSLALSLRELNYVDKIYGSDHNKEHCESAIKLNLVDEIVDFETITKCDLIVLAVPVNGVISILKELVHVDESTTIIDLGSTKKIIVDNVPPQIRENFVALHPMAGRENFGPQAAIKDLYKDSVVVFCDIENSAQLHRDRAIKIFTDLKMKLHYMEADAHDRHAAFISHMPHLISYSIANTVLAQEDKHSILTLAAGGFRSMSRLAKSSPNMWEDIFRQNKKNLVEALDLFEAELKNLRQDVESEKWDDVNNSLKNANKLYDIFS
ncbi:MAG: prephenate dehydrogenase [Campylobacterota bacterium]|nr:prephenate dehydrogenase [Campylobacterota bacterium]